MKNKIIIFLFVFVLIFTACDDNTIEIPINEYNKLKGIKPPPPPEYPKLFSFRFNYTIKNIKDVYVTSASDGHEYIIISCSDTQGAITTTASQWVECKKCKKLIK